MEVKIISRETIKPCIKTLKSQKTLKLSLLDQLSPPTYSSLVSFYSSDSDHFKPEVAVATLRNSLSETLCHCELLAGKIEDDNVDCNGYGAVFVEAKLNCRMSEFFKPPPYELLDRLFPTGVWSAGDPDFSVQVAFQINIFSCGGIAISASFFHKLIDATTFSYFLRSWASIAIGSFKNPLTEFDYRQISELFPQRRAEFSHLFKESPFCARGETLMRRFVFKTGQIVDLKRKANSKTVPNPTTVEVVTGFIWKHALKASWNRYGSKKSSLLNHAVNLRTRMNPQLPENSAGNIFWISRAIYGPSSPEMPFDELVGLVRQSFEEINDDYIQKMKGEDGFGHILKSLEELQELYSQNPCSYLFSSWRNMGLNELEYGWGKPVWTAIGGISRNGYRNVVNILDNESGDGVEAWIVLDEEEMKILENDDEFLAFTSLNPTIPFTDQLLDRLRDLNLRIKQSN